MCTHALERLKRHALKSFWNIGGKWLGGVTKKEHQLQEDDNEVKSGSDTLTVLMWKPLRHILSHYSQETQEFRNQRIPSKQRSDKTRIWMQLQHDFLYPSLKSNRQIVKIIHHVFLFFLRVQYLCWNHIDTLWYEAVLHLNSGWVLSLKFSPWTQEILSQIQSLKDSSAHGVRKMLQNAQPQMLLIGAPPPRW